MWHVACACETLRPGGHQSMGLMTGHVFLKFKIACAGSHEGVELGLAIWCRICLVALCKIFERTFFYI